MLLRRRIAATLFFAILWAPLAGMWMGIGQFRSGEENRRLEPSPKIGSDPRKWQEFSTQFTRYFVDHFGFRATLIMLHSWLKAKVIGVSTSREVIIGRHEWLFYTGDYSIESYRGARPFDPTELEAWVRMFKRRVDWLARRNIQSLVVIAPNKQTIYPEYMPGTIPRSRSGSRLDHFAAAVGPDVRVTDLRPSLLEAKSQYPRLYYRTDSHWNGYGAYIGYRAIAGEVAKLYPEIKPMPQSDCLLNQVRQGGDLTNMLGIPWAFTETMDYIGPRRLRHMEGGRKLVGFIDSFGLQLEGFMRTNFGSVVFKRQYEFDPGVVLYNKPDLVIFVLCERRLNSGPPVDPVQVMDRLDTDPSGKYAREIVSAVQRTQPVSHPFGNIDSPASGQTISGQAFVNFGWVVTQQPNRIALDGSGIDVLVDGQLMGHPNYGKNRPDVADIYSELINAEGAGGYFYLDTTKLVNGRHSICWRATDSGGNTGETAMRTFFVQN